MGTKSKNIQGPESPVSQPNKDIPGSPPPDKLIASTYYVQVSKKWMGKEEVQTKAEEGMIAFHKFATEPAKANASFGLTLSLGKYEFARLDVGVSIPCYREQLEETVEFAKDFVAEKVNKEKDEIKESLKQEKENGK